MSFRDLSVLRLFYFNIRLNYGNMFLSLVFYVNDVELNIEY